MLARRHRLFSRYPMTGRSQLMSGSLRTRRTTRSAADDLSFPFMHRLASALALVALSQSLVLGTGVLCDVRDGKVATSSDMQGMPMGGALANGDAPEPAHDRHHGGAHCPLMSTCGVMAMRTAATDVQVSASDAQLASVASIEAPRSDESAPEPPPPKR